MSPSRRVTRILAIGVVLNVLVAWALATWAQVGLGVEAPPPQGMQEGGPPPSLKWKARVPSDWPAPWNVVAARGAGIDAHLGSSIPGQVTAVSVGWPWKSLRSVVVWRVSAPREPQSLVRAGVVIPVRALEVVSRSRRTVGTIDLGNGPVPQVITSERKASVTRRLPFTPLWAGFLINSLVYTVAFTALSRSALAIRSHVRRRAGKCIGCGYSRAGLAGGACPECGMGEGKAVRKRECAGEQL